MKVDTSLLLTKAFAVRLCRSNARPDPINDERALELEPIESALCSIRRLPVVVASIPASSLRLTKPTRRRRTQKRGQEVLQAAAKPFGLSNLHEVQFALACVGQNLA